jgi:hypothetical protein
VPALAAGPLRRRLSFGKAVLSAPMLGGILIVLLAATRWYWTALVLWASIWGLVVFFDIRRRRDPHRAPHLICTTSEC